MHPAPPPGRSGSGGVAPLLVILALSAIVIAYAATAFVTKDRWMPSSTTTSDRTRVTFEAATGVETTPDGLARARDVLQARAVSLGMGEVQAAVDGDAVTLSVPGSHTSALRDIGALGQLGLRPVIHSTPAQPSATPAPAPPVPPSQQAQQIADERQLRQSTDPKVQILALQFQTGRCDQPDPLAGHDDPELPLVTCSRDGQTVYLLDRTLLDGSQIDSATSGLHEASGQYVVDVQFGGDAPEMWADYTSDHIGTQVAFAVDTEVVSAPQIQEEIPGGRTQITGDFDEAGARDLAATLDAGALPFPMTVESSATEQVEQQTDSTLWRVALIVGGVVVGTAVVGGVLFLTWLSRRNRGAALSTPRM